MKLRCAISVGVLLAWMLCASAAAHEAFPARLLMEETEPGIYKMTFTLPVVEGRRLRAEPVLPPICRDLTEREEGLRGASFVTTWTLRCDALSLAGEPIRIKGLLGTQTEVMLRIETLDGRKRAVILKPAPAIYVVPYPPSRLALLREAIAAGVRQAIRRPELWVFLLVAVLPATRRRSLVATVSAYAGGHAAGQWIAGQGWILLAPHFAPVAASLTALVPALGLARRESQTPGWLRPLWLIALFLGLLYGAAHPETLPAEGLSRHEQGMAFAAYGVGIGLGVALLTIIALQFRRVLHRLSAGTARQRAVRIAGHAAGIIACALLLYNVSGFVHVQAALPAPIVGVLLLSAILGLWFGDALRRRAGWITLPFAMILTAGFALGLSGVTVPFLALGARGSLFLFGGALAIRRRLPIHWSARIAAVAVLCASWIAGLAMGADLSLPIAQSVGHGVLAVCVLYISLRLAESHAGAAFSLGARILGTTAALLVIVWRIGDYRLWVNERVLPDAAMGLVHVPVVALGLIIAAFVAYTLRPRAAPGTGAKVRRSMAHWIILMHAFFMLRVGAMPVRNPFFVPHAPRGDAAMRVLTRVLSNTYRAFNLEDEDELYDRLAENVTEDLVTDVYLDSRRRLVAGTREGSRVTVRDVSILSLDEPTEGVDNEDGFSYPCTWVVTARVQHMQHVHHRQNIYAGVLTIRIDEDRWKIARLELTGEDRVIVSRGSAS